MSQPKCNLILLFSWIPDDGMAPATGIRRVDLELTNGHISPVSVRSALFKVAGYPGKFSRRAMASAVNGEPPPPPPPQLPPADDAGDAGEPRAILNVPSPVTGGAVDHVHPRQPPTTA